MGNPPFEDISPIENGGFPASYVSLPEGNPWFCCFHQPVGRLISRKTPTSPPEGTSGLSQTHAVSTFMLGTWVPWWPDETITRRWHRGRSSAEEIHVAHTVDGNQKSGNHHLLDIKKLVNNGINNYQPQLVSRFSSINSILGKYNSSATSMFKPSMEWGFP